MGSNMKKFLFVINNMHIGGTRSSLLNLLKYLEKETDVEVYLYLLSNHGEYLNMIPKGITQIETGWISDAVYAKPAELTKLQIIIRAFIKLLRQFFGDERVYTLINKKLTNKIGIKFDVAIAFSEGEPVNFVAETMADRRYAWIHNDFSNLTGTKAGYEYALKKLNKIFFVADAAKKDFQQAYPIFTDKLGIIKNTINFEGIIEKANFDTDVSLYDLNKINIVSVGRVSNQKAFERIPEVMYGLKQSKIVWHIIGDGEEMSNLSAMVTNSEFCGEIILHGAKQNPYPYIKYADLLVVTSLYESQPMVILEALSLGTPVISTNFTSACELLKDKEYGVLCDNSVEGITEAVKVCMKGNNLDEMRSACSQFQYDNVSIVREIIEL